MFVCVTMYVTRQKRLGDGAMSVFMGHAKTLFRLCGYIHGTCVCVCALFCSFQQTHDYCCVRQLLIYFSIPATAAFVVNVLKNTMPKDPTLGVFLDRPFLIASHRFQIKDGNIACSLNNNRSN